MFVWSKALPLLHDDDTDVEISQLLQSVCVARACFQLFYWFSMGKEREREGGRERFKVQERGRERERLKVIHLI